MIPTYIIGRHSETYITRYSQIDYTSALLVGPSINTSTHSDRRVGGKAHYLIVFEASNTRLYTLHQCTPLPCPRECQHDSNCGSRSPLVERTFIYRCDVTFATLRACGWVARYIDAQHTAVLSLRPFPNVTFYA